jgi:hypothetical protein
LGSPELVVVVALFGLITNNHTIYFIHCILKTRILFITKHIYPNLFQQNQETNTLNTKTKHINNPLHGQTFFIALVERAVKPKNVLFEMYLVDHGL